MHGAAQYNVLCLMYMQSGILRQVRRLFAWVRGQTHEVPHDQNGREVPHPLKFQNDVVGLG